MRRFISVWIILISVALSFNVCAALVADNPTHNYILIIDNSRSTTGRHSLGSATDPKGLRFDAAKLVYENVLSSAETGRRGQIGVIVFCGTENCVNYGPLPIDADADTLYQAIGSNLNESANRETRDNYTDIKTALEAARDMLDGFTGGDTSLILLTDGVNDLTNRSDPFNQPENIEANDQTVDIIRELHEGGVEFYVIALTASDTAQDTDAFMAFINRMAEAGGGEPTAGGAYSNVLMATQSDLNSKLLQMLIRAESVSETDIQNIVEYTPVEASFTVPYEGISDTTVNITFMPDDKRRLSTIELTSPDGNVHMLYDGDGAHSIDGFTVTEDRSYIILGMVSPQPGEWRVSIASEKQAEVPVNAVVRFNHNLRLQVGMSDIAHVNATEPVIMWLERYNGEQYEALSNSDIYAMSNATLTLTPPDGKTPRTIEMMPDNSCFYADFVPDAAGDWVLAFEARNEYWSERADGFILQVLPEPTATPAPESTSAPLSDSNDSSLGSTSGGVSDFGNGMASGNGSVTGADSGNIPAGDASGMGIAESIKESLNTLANISEDGSIIVKDAEEGSDFEWKVDVSEDGEQIDVSWKGAPKGATASLYEEGSNAPVITDINSGDSVSLEELGMEVSYTLLLSPGPAEEQISEMPFPVESLDLKVVSGIDEVSNAMLEVAGIVVQLAPTLTSSEDAVESLKESLNTIKEATADSAGGASGESDAGSGGESLPAPAGDAAFEVSGGSESVEGTRTNAVVTSEAGETASQAERFNPLDLLKANWVYAVVGAAALVLLIAIILIIRDKSAKRVKGNLRLECEPIKLSILLRFQGSGSIKVDSPLTSHPDIAKLKGSKAYDVLSNIRVSMVKPDESGATPDIDMPQHTDDEWIRLTFTDPNTGEQRHCDVSMHSPVASTLTVTDTGRNYELSCSGTLTFDELVYGRR